jgi:hypothetical protein
MTPSEIQISSMPRSSKNDGRRRQEHPILSRVDKLPVDRTSIGNSLAEGSPTVVVHAVGLLLGTALLLGSFGFR